jgi:AcrR family transcriptional regulator
MPSLPEGGHAARRAPKQSRAKATFERIRKATIELAREHGFSGLNTIDIASRAGVSVGSLYEYFPNREAILLSIYEDTIAELVSSIKIMLPNVLDEPLRKAIHKTAAELLSSYKKNQLILLDLPIQMPELRLSGHAISFDQLVHGYLRLFLAHRKQGESPILIEQRAFLIENILIGSIQNYLRKLPPRFSAKAFLNHLVMVIGDYIERPIPPV